jgi:hypothetical protein
MHSLHAVIHIGFLLFSQSPHFMALKIKHNLADHPKYLTPYKVREIITVAIWLLNLCFGSTQQVEKYFTKLKALIGRHPARILFET